MCGLAGRFDSTALSAAPDWHVRASRALAHRGPDGEGHFADSQCELVHRRLALIDLTPTGHQPLANEDGQVLIVFNGEIYNHRELRQDLVRRGHVFRGTSDTEVIVHLYEELGERAVAQLRGIFAFALYDRRRRQMLLARDRFGVKPLFYATIAGECVFASEIKAIAAHPRFQPVLDRQACYDYVGLGYIPEPATGFANVHALLPGTMRILTTEGARDVPYHQVGAAPQGDRHIDDVTSEVAERLLRSVDSQRVADVPVAALLSGGIDSSLVVAAYRRTSDQPITTFNVRFPRAEDDETAMALAVSNHYGTRHHVIDIVDHALSPEALLGLFAHFDQPFADTSLIPTFAISQAIRERGIICALSGDGGDEAFGGYASFWRLNRLVQLMRLPDWIRHATRDAAKQLAGWTQDLGRQVSKATALADAGREEPAVLLAGLANYLSEQQKEELVLPAARLGLAPVYRHYETGPDTDLRPGDLEGLSRRLTENQFAVSLPSDMLRKVDMMSMRASIEVRVPLLDEAVVDLGVGLSHRLKTDGRTGKQVLRNLADRWLPRRVAKHPKHGFQIPLDHMVPQDFHVALHDLLLGAGARTRSLFDQTLLADWLQAFRDRSTGRTLSRGGLYQRIITALGLELWLRGFGLAW